MTTSASPLKPRRAPAAAHLIVRSALAMKQLAGGERLGSRAGQELERALTQELVFEGDRGEVRLPERPKLDRLADVLRSFPKTRVVVVGEAPFARSERQRASFGTRDAEAVARYLSDRSRVPAGATGVEGGSYASAQI